HALPLAELVQTLRSPIISQPPNVSFEGGRLKHATQPSSFDLPGGRPSLLKRLLGSARPIGPTRRRRATHLEPFASAFKWCAMATARAARNPARPRTPRGSGASPSLSTTSSRLPDPPPRRFRYALFSDTRDGVTPIACASRSRLD